MPKSFTHFWMAHRAPRPLLRPSARLRMRPTRGVVPFVLLTIITLILSACGTHLDQSRQESQPREPTVVAQAPGPAIAKGPLPGKPMTVDLGPSTGSGQGGGVVMEFVWVEPLKMWVGKYEVTNEQIRRKWPEWNAIDAFGAPKSGMRSECGDAALAVINGDRMPAPLNAVETINMFLTFLNDVARGQIGGGLEFRLPYDWEWSVAAGLDEPREGTPLEKDGKILGEYPWGTQWPPPPGTGNFQDEATVEYFHATRHEYMDGYNDGYPFAAPVGSFKANQYGLYDMEGNLMETCQDTYNGLPGYGYHSKSGGSVMRGGDWFVVFPSEMLSSSRRYHWGWSHGFCAGFRVVCADPARVVPSPPAQTAADKKAAAVPSQPKPPAPMPATAKRPPPGEPLTADLGDGVVMEFVWVEPLGMRVGKYEVTNGEYRRYKPDHNSGEYWLSATPKGGRRTCLGGSLNGERQPVVRVSWDDAKAFCRWLTEKARREGKIGVGLEYRLPRDWEWSVAVGLDEPRDGTPQEKDGKIAGPDWQVKMVVTPWSDFKANGKIVDVFPWGTEWPPVTGSGAGNYRDFYGIPGYRDGYFVTAPVGSFMANQYGLYDLGGNVNEWCEDYYNGASGRRVLRGGSWESLYPRLMLSSIRYLGKPANRMEHAGFRVVCGAPAGK